MIENYDGNLEFLSFLADISHPGTGEIRADALALWLGVCPKELAARWQHSGHAEWADYANDVLRVLDLMQDHTHQLSRTITWFRELPAGSAFQATADQLVARGRTEEVIRAIREGVAGDGRRSKQERQGEKGIVRRHGS